jgi:Flp pilus assembly protein TadD
LSPEDAFISLVAGRLAYQTGDFNWAASLLKQSVSKSPQSPEPRYWLAVSSLALGKVQEAQTEMSKLLQVQIDFPQKQEANKFVSFLNMADHPETASVAQLQAALTADPYNLSALWAISRIQEKSNPAQAAPIYERILTRYASFYPANRQLAFFYYQQSDQHEKAYQNAIKAYRAPSQETNALLAKLVGILAYQRNDFAGSITVLKDLSRTQTSDPDVFYYLGMAHYRVKEKSESAQALRQAIALKVNDRFAAEAKRVLAELQ